ncbi:uncharacterized protein [Eurosta solidaginis]|uniref:uncharacterized protein isoform X2 n=1 Tax=Eurosta solidaginis TaxID=178769 RepID=UPI003530ED56
MLFVNFIVNFTSILLSQWTLKNVNVQGKKGKGKVNPKAKSSIINNELHRKTQTNWEAEETNLLLELWQDCYPSLNCQRPNLYLYQNMSKTMMDRGYNKSPAEVVCKVYKLKDKYRIENKRLEETGIPSTWELYEKVKNIFHGSEYLYWRDFKALLLELWERKLPSLNGSANNVQIYTDLAMELSTYGFNYTSVKVKHHLKHLLTKYFDEKKLVDTLEKPSSWKYYIQIDNMVRGHEEIFNRLYSIDMTPPAWPRALTEELIALLEERECLWDTTCAEYTERETRNAAIREIHAKELRQIEVSKRDASGGDDGVQNEVRTPSMWCYDKLQFLLPNLKMRYEEDGDHTDVKFVQTHIKPRRAQAIKKIMPMLDRILIKRVEAVSTTKGGIMLPEQSVKKTKEGTVVAVGPGSRNAETGSYIPLGVKEGDRVLLPDYGGTPVDIGDKKEYLIYREADILAKLE